MSTIKKSAVGSKTTKTAADSTDYFAARNLKAEKLLDAAEKEGLGKVYNQKYIDNATKNRQDYRDYQQRKNSANSTATLKKGGKIKPSKKK